MGSGEVHSLASRSRMSGGLVAALSCAAVVAVLAVRLAPRDGGAVLLPQPWQARYEEFHANDGSAEPVRYLQSIGNMAAKAGARQEWLEHSQHRSGALQRARRQRGVGKRGRVGELALPARRTTQLLDGTPLPPDSQGTELGGEGESGKLRKGFEDDDASLFGDASFSEAEAPTDCGHVLPPLSESTASGSAPQASDFLAGMVKAVSTEAMPPAASAVLQTSVANVHAAKAELQEAAKLRAAAAVDAQRAKGLASREAELEDYSRKKQAWAAQEKKIADRAEAEYVAEEQELRAMGGSSTPDRDSAGAGLELLRIVDKIRRHVAGAGKRRTQKRLATQR